MFRLRLALVIVIAFALVLMLGFGIYRGSMEVASYFQRSRTAYQTFEHYQRLSQQATRHFNQRVDYLIVASHNAQSRLEESKRLLQQTMDGLRDSVAEHAAGFNENLAADAELARVAQLTAFLEASEYRFAEVERLHRLGKREQAVEALKQFVEREIEGRFQPMIDAAIAVEKHKAVAAESDLERLLARSRQVVMVVVAIAVGFGLLAGVLLWRGVRRPIDALMKGTDEIAGGNFGYRIKLDSRDEFSYLATHFNQMALELGLQQQRLREHRAQLEKTVAERTMELRQLNETLTRMDSSRREFLADIGHELRTPITIIRGEAEVTLRGASHSIEEYRDSLQRVVELSEQLAKYVNDLLFIARADSTDLQFDCDPVNLSLLVESVVEDFQVMAAEKAIEVACNVPREAVWVHADKQRLRQLLFILGDNACRYSRPGGSINVDLRCDDEMVCVAIADTGIGIASDDIAHIFERNFRGGNAEQLRSDGSGLGLAVAKSIVDTHGGRIEVDSEVSRGSAFSVYLPLFKPV